MIMSALHSREPLISHKKNLWSTDYAAAISNVFTSYRMGKSIIAPLFSLAEIE